jgi:hypothetical protein
MSNQLFGFYFTGDADKSTHDRTIFVDVARNGNAVIEARYKNAEHNTLYTIELDHEDLECFGAMCINLAKQMRSGGS